MVVLSWLFGYPKPAHTTNADSNIKTPPAPPLPTPSTLQQQQEQQQQPPAERSAFLSPRSLRQFGLFLGGAGFFYWSVMLSRRAVTRHQIAAKLKFFQPSHNPPRPRGSGVDGTTGADAIPRKDPLVAVEALNLATLNTLTSALMVGGGVAWAFDISSLEDLRRYTRRSIVNAAGKAEWGEEDVQAEKEVVDWVASTFGIEEKKGGGAEEGEGK